MTLDERIARYLDKCQGAISGSDGHGQTFTVACALVNGFALDADAALRHLITYNATCSPPWSPRELRHKVNQAEGKRRTASPGVTCSAPTPTADRMLSGVSQNRFRYVWRLKRGNYGRFGRFFFTPQITCARTHTLFWIVRNCRPKRPNLPKRKIRGRTARLWEFT